MQTLADIPSWWCSTTQICVVLLIINGHATREICFNQSEALPRSGLWQVFSHTSDMISRGNQLLLVVKCWLFSQASPEAKAYNFIACIASISVRFRSKERGTRVKDRVKNGEKWLSFHFSRGQNRKSRSSGFFAQKLNGNTCYTGR